MENNLKENLNNNKIIETTFKEIGKRSLKSIAEHILKENVYEGNLINDISGVDYTKNNHGKTHLQEIDGFGLFVDDLYVYGYLRKEDIVFNPKGGVSCTEGLNGSACFVVEILRSIVKQTIGKNSNLPHINIMHTVEIKNVGNSNILKTIVGIEQEKDVRKKWEERTLQKAFAVFVVKIDLSNIPIRELQKYIVELEQSLFTTGYYIYCVDYTHDFSGTMDKEELIEYLLQEEDFVEEGDVFSVEKTNVVLKNDSSVGKNVLTYLRKGGENSLRIKFYNKIVSNLEAGEVRSLFGGHIYDYVYSSNERLRRLFWHPDVKQRGITRIEISVYGKQGTLNENIGEVLIRRELDLVGKTEKLFYIQQAKNQWKALAENLQQCFILVDRPHSIIYIAWYGNSITGRIAGVKVDYVKKKDKEDIENLTKWAISDFGFRMVPIYRADILEYTNETIRISPLKCYAKDKSSTTILVPCNKVGKFTEDVLNIDLEEYLPSTEFLKWEWRKKKLASSNDRKPNWRILDMPDLVKNKEISLLSLKQREKRNAELEEARRKTAWVRKAEKILLTHLEKIKYISTQLELIERRKEKTEEAFKFVSGKLKNLSCNTLKEGDVGVFYLLGWTAGKFNSMVLLQDVEDKEKYKFIYANTRLEKYLKLFTPFFNQKELKINKTIKFYRPINNNYTDYFKIKIEEKQRFLKGNVWIEYFPIHVDTNINIKLSIEIEKNIKRRRS